MKAKQAALLFIRQQIEWNDGRIAIVQQNDSEHRQIRMQFQDGTIGVSRYEDLFFAEVMDLTRPN